jgi:hypothetical protein
MLLSGNSPLKQHLAKNEAIVEAIWASVGHQADAKAAG